MALRALPQSKKLNIRLGLLLGILGTLVAFISFSGNFAYDIRFFYLALVSTIVALYGLVLLANSRVVSAKRTKLKEANTGPREWVRLECPNCKAIFEEEGQRPFNAVCPVCKSSGRIA